MVIYFHGLGGASSQKRPIFEQAFRELLKDSLSTKLFMPTYHDKDSYRNAIESAVELVRGATREPSFVVGTSLGGFAAVITAGRTGAFASLINPSLTPAKTLRGKVDEDWWALLTELTEESLSYRNKYQTDAGYKAYINRDDELLYPFDVALANLAINNVVEFPRGGHRADNFESEILPRLIEDYRNLERGQRAIWEMEEFGRKG